MAEQSKIAWTDATFNMWRGCQRVSEGCRHCYAETLSKRNPATLGTWGPEGIGSRTVAAEAAWRDVEKWDRKAFVAMSGWDNGIEAIYKGDESLAIADGFLKPHRPRVFVASLADVFEDWQGPMRDAKGRILGQKEGQFPRWWNPVESEDQPITMSSVRERLFLLIELLENLDFLLLTKRPENVLGMIPSDWLGAMPSNVWMGTTVENREAAWKRLPELVKIPARVRFVSAEPLLEDIADDLAPFLCSGAGHTDREIDQVIVGGESGAGARPFDLGWARKIKAVCRDSGTAFFMKQTGSNPYTERYSETFRYTETIPFETNHPKGENPAEWPADLNIQEFPQATERVL